MQKLPLNKETNLEKFSLDVIKKETVPPVPEGCESLNPDLLSLLYQNLIALPQRGGGEFWFYIVNNLYILITYTNIKVHFVI